MPATNLGPDRWVSAGVNEGGDQMYQRNRAAPATTGPHGSQPPEAAETSYEDLTKEELSAALESRGLPKTGNKDELIARLEEADKA